MNKRPIIIIEDDNDDQEMLREVFMELEVPNEIHFFDSCEHVFNYLMESILKPLLIISDINLPAMTGFQLKQKINATESLRKRNIPFIFLTTNGDQRMIQQAYDIAIQGYFVKPSSMAGIKEIIRKILDYWKISRLPETE
jgi:DNA-binding NtrC family response regulator